MIPDIEIKKLVDKLDDSRILKFFRKNSTNSVYYHYAADTDLGISTPQDTDNQALQIPTLAIEEDTYLVLHNSQKLSQKLASDQYQVASIRTSDIPELAASLPAVNGIAIQCRDCYFTIDLEELKTGLTEPSS